MTKQTQDEKRKRIIAAIDVCWQGIAPDAIQSAEEVDDPLDAEGAVEVTLDCLNLDPQDRNFFDNMSYQEKKAAALEAISKYF